MQKEFIDTEKLAEEIAIALRDEFTALIGCSANVIRLVFENGEHFTLTLKKEGREG